MKKSLSLAVVSVLLTVAISGCTRKTDDKKMRVSIPINTKIGALVNYDLEIAILNVQIDGKAPMVLKKEFHDDSATRPAKGTPIVFDVPEVDRGVNVFIQALNVYKGSATGDMQFYYQDKTINTGSGFATDIELLPSGTSNGTQAQIAGRFLTSMSGGPTGTLNLVFKPSNGKSAMIVEQSSVVNGWFEAFAVNGANFDIVVAGSGLKIFEDLTVDVSGNVQHRVHATPGDVGTITNLSFGGAQRLHMLKPAGFRKEYGSSEVKPEPETHMILGFFDHNSDAYASGLNRTVVYSSSSFGVPGAFTDSALTQVQNYDALGSGSDIRHVAGGLSAPFDYVYLNTATDCGAVEQAAGTCLIFYDAKLANNGREGFSGIKMPFRTLDKLSMRGGQLKTEFASSGCTTSPCIKLKWDLLPGTVSALSSVEIYAKSGSNSSSGNPECSELEAMGYAKVQTVAPATQTIEHSPAGLTSSNYWNNSYYVCAKRASDAGPVFVGRPLRSDCIGSCSESTNQTGWSIAGSATISTPTQLLTHKKVSGITSFTDPETTTFITPSPVAFNMGDELMITVMGMDSSGRCGSMDGSSIQVGSYDFVRYIGGPDSSTHTVTKGKLLEAAASSGVTGGVLAATPPSNFCAIQAVAVKHYNDLYINAGVGLYLSTAFTYGNNGGGVLAMRVSGTLHMAGNSYIKASGFGFTGGSISYHGSGFDLDSNNTTKPSNGGGLASSIFKGGGGGGYGQGGVGSSGSDGAAGSGSMGGGNIRMIMGGGGGGSSSNSGAAGGGLVFLSANKIDVGTSTGNYIAADGVSLTSGETSGAGGGGSVFVFAKSVVSSGGGGDLEIRADGGNGDGTGLGGVGGGGSVAHAICEQDALVTLMTGANKGSVGADNGSLAGDGDDDDLTISQSWMCESP